MYDTLELLRPRLHICASWDDASQAADALDKEFASKLGELLGLLAGWFVTMMLMMMMIIVMSVLIILMITININRLITTVIFMLGWIGLSKV